MLNTNDNVWDTDVAEGVVIIDIWAEWCGPCKDLADLLWAIEPDFPDVRIFTAKLEDNLKHARKLNVMTLPTLAFYIDGKLMDVTEGVPRSDQLIKAINHWRGVYEQMQLVIRV